LELIKGSKNADFSLVSRKSTSQKIGLLGWRAGPGNLSQRHCKSTPTYDVTHRSPQTQNWKTFF